jgi:hypothetical protein
VATAVTVPGQDPDLVYHSFPIEKFDEDPETGTLYVYGKATSPDLDSDEQVVDADWSAGAMETWFKSGPNVRVMHNPTAMPAGSGVKVEINRDGDGAHWVKAAVDDPTAKRMVERKHLRAFSVGIARPLIVTDVTGKARGGIIKGGELAEISLVDRPANRSCYVEIAKAASDGTAEFTGKVFGADDFLAKGTVNVDLPKGVSVSFSPEDLKKLLEHRREAEDRQNTAAQADAAEKGELSAADRAKLPASAFAYVDSSGERHLPVHDEGHVHSALGRFGEQQFEDGSSKRKAARKIIARAREMGISVDEDSDVAQAAGKVAQPGGVKADGEKCGLCKGKGKIRGGALTCPRCHGDGKIAAGEPDEHDEVQDKDETADLAKAGARSCKECGKNHHSDSPAKFCDGCGTKLPAASEKEEDPDVVKDDGGDGGGTGEDGPDDADQDSDDGDDGDDPDDAPAAKAAAPAMTGKPKVPCPSCGKGVKASMAFCGKCGGSMKADKAGKPTPGDGVTGEHVEPVPAHREPDGPAIESLEHDAGLPTDPDGPHLKSADPEWAAALRFKALGIPADLGALHDLTCAAYAPADVAKAHPYASLADVDEDEWREKALDAAASAPLPEAGAMQLLWQHAITLKAADPEIVSEVSGALHKAFADANPGPGTFPTPGELSPQRFRRPYLTAGHAAPSPGQDAPHTAKIPPSGGITAGQFDRGYLDAGHAADSPQNKADGGDPPKPGASNGGRLFYRNTSRDNTRAAMQAMHDHIASTFPDVCAMKSDPEADPMPKPGPLPRPVGSAKEAKAGKRRDPAPATAPAPAAPVQPEAVSKAAGAMSPDIVKAAVAEAVTEALAARDAGYEEELRKLRKLIKSQGDVLDAIADQPDPASPYRGAALPQNTKTTTAPAGPLTMAGAAEQSQAALYAELHREWLTTPDPTTRLAAERAMERMRGIPFTS